MSGSAGPETHNFNMTAINKLTSNSSLERPFAFPSSLNHILAEKLESFPLIACVAILSLSHLHHLFSRVSASPVL